MPTTLKMPEEKRTGVLLAAFILIGLDGNSLTMKRVVRIFLEVLMRMLTYNVA